ncbi:MAG: rhomboid family intramembrane serine protease [Planctomycetota bacterium]|nr:rhomboid family intramembrane serine protease [Planctomycetota bacterium]
MSAWRPEWDEAAKSGGDGGLSLGPVTVPLWTKRLLLANLGIFVVLYLLGATGYRISNVLAVNPTWWWTEPPFLPLWQVLTYGFVHDLSGFGHVLYNSLVLFFFGSMLERALGGRRFLAFYLAALLAGGLLHAVLSPIGVHEVSLADGRSILTGPFYGPMVGASGAIVACLVACAMLFPRATMILFVFPIPLWVGATGLVVMDLLAFTRMEGQVAYHVHLAGALLGYLFIKRRWHLRAVPNPVEVLADRRRAGEQRSRQQDEQRMDELLARISRDGMGSLSSSEKEFLKRMSKRS